MKNSIVATLIACSLAVPAFAATEEIIFATAPTHPAEVTKKTYQPLLDFLSAKTGKKFTMNIPDSFIRYSSEVQAAKYDLVFDGPHISGWRMDRQQHTPIVVLPGEIKIVVAVREDSSISKLEDLQYGIRVCALTPPNLLTMAMLSYFPNPAKQPDLIRIQGFNNLPKCLKSKKGDAAVLRDKFWAKAQKSDAAKGLKIIAAPERGYPERTFTTGPKIDVVLRDQIIQLLLSEEGQKAAAPILSLFKKQKLVKADPKQYVGLGNLINSVWGFQ